MAKTTIIFIALFIISTTAGIVNHISYRSSLKSWKQAVANRDTTVANLNAQVATLQAEREKFVDPAEEIAAMKDKIADCTNRLALYQDDQSVKTNRQSTKTTTTTPDNHSTAPGGEAIAMAKEFVKKNLTYPESAKFPLFQVDNEDLGGNRFKVSGKVDAKNGFGAELRYNYTVVLYKKGEYWHAETVDIQP